jgi:RNA polymerase sigma-70 factor (ECF subfamily)
MREPISGVQGIADGVLQSELRLEAGRLTRNAADAEDLVQDTLERGLRKYERHTYGSLRAWLLHIMRNLFIDRYRSRRAMERRMELLSLPSEPAPLPRWAQVSDAALEAAIVSLDPGTRSLILLREREGLSYAQISARLAIPVATVGTRLLRARRKLRALLEQASAAPESIDERGARDVQYQ